MAAKTLRERVLRKWYGAGLGKPGLREKLWLLVLDHLEESPRKAMDLIAAIAKVDAEFPPDGSAPSEEQAQSIAGAIAQLASKSA